jgi:hypothetical protein
MEMPRFHFLPTGFLVRFSSSHPRSETHTTTMPGISLADTINQLSVNGEWGPETVSSTTLDGVPYAPYSKGDKLGRMADWTQEGKDREGRGGRQFNRNYRGFS